MEKMEGEMEKTAIRTAVQAFARGSPRDNALEFFAALGYDTSRSASLAEKTASYFTSLYVSRGQTFNADKALCGDWNYVDVLFQVTDSEMEGVHGGKYENKEINSFLFLIIELSQQEYSRTALAASTREMNKVFPMPTIVLFKYGGFLTLSVIDRRINKQDEQKDVLEKVSLIKDMVIAEPHRAHIDILYDLSFTNLQSIWVCTNFAALHNAWQKTLDTKELNKRFYRELSNWYFWAIDKVQFPDDLEKNTDIRNSVNLIRLITRIIFIWFIKEKFLVPQILFNRIYLETILKDFNKSETSHSYYNAILQNLFFGTLNQKMNEREFISEDRYQGKNKQYNVTTLFRYADLFSISQDTVKDLFKDIPFLNGGLFDCLDKSNKDNPKKIDRVDGFSQNPKHQAIIPDYVFFGAEREVDLNAVYDTRNKKYHTEGLIPILQKYKFTVTENTPLEEEVALDPELLGKVFENLLASYNPETKMTARKQTGSFYTPREIVEYMTDESLIAYLKQAVPSKDAEVRLRDLCSYAENPNPFNEPETKALIAAIDHAKILDPACGSGAFPMGILHKLVWMLKKLDPENSLWKAQQKETILGKEISALKQDKATIRGLSDTEVRQKAEEAVESRMKELEDIFNREYNFDDYARKLYLIENCIYGVDIQPIAVQIAKLRFFISLIIDQKANNHKENQGIRSLPNLETKFVAANTLIGLLDTEQKDLLDLQDADLIAMENELWDIRGHKMFSADTRQKKIKYKKAINDLCEQIGVYLITHGVKPDYQKIEADRSLIAKFEAELSRLPEVWVDEQAEVDLFEIKASLFKRDINEEKRKQLSQEIKRLQEEIAKEAKKAQFQGLEATIEKMIRWDPYDQNTAADWFDPKWMFGVQEGFDVVIGNPPYFVITNSHPQKSVYEATYSKLRSGRINIYQLFFGRSESILNSTGCIVFIHPKTLLADAYLAATRAFLLNAFKSFTIINIISRTDTFGAVLQSVVVSLWTKDIRKNCRVAEVLKKIDFQHLQYLEMSLEKIVSQNEILIVSGNPLVYEIEKKCRLVPRIPIHFITGSIEWNKFVDHLSGTKKRNSKQLIYGENIQRFYFAQSTRRTGTTFINGNINVPIISCLSIFVQRTTAVEQPYRIIACIIDPQKFDVTLVSENHTNVFECKDITFAYYFLGILNSKLMDFYFRIFNSNTQVSSRELNQLPIIQSNDKKFAKVVSLVRDICQQKKANLQADTKPLERKIDQLVYKLYGLTDAEIKLIEEKE
jgi:tRNA1(Val) A37 N6-methylase TrmN6